MERLKSRKTAAVIAAVGIILSTLLGVRVSVGRATAKVERMFYEGVYTTYLEPGIAGFLEDRLTASNGLASLAAGNTELTDMAQRLLAARRRLSEAKTIAEKAKANGELEAAYRACAEALEKAGLDERERKMLSAYNDKMYGAQGAIMKNPYNLKVAELRRQLEWFPMNLLTKIVSAPYPQYFE